MNLQEAIKHLDDMLSDKSKDWSCESCKHEHEQLRDWLKELQEYKLSEVKPSMSFNVGDTIYRIDTDIRSKNKEVEPCIIDNIVICGDGDILLKADAHDDIICTANDLINGTPYLDHYRVFFTYEEAEAALANLSKQEGNG